MSSSIESFIFSILTLEIRGFLENSTFVSPIENFSAPSGEIPKPVLLQNVLENFFATLASNLSIFWVVDVTAKTGIDDAKVNALINKNTRKDLTGKFLLLFMHS